MNKKLLIGMGLASTALVFTVFTGCGGGGSSSGTTSPTAELTSASAQTLAINAAEALPGCSFVSDSVVTSASPAFAVIYQSAIKEVVDDSQSSASTKSVTVRLTTIDESTEGSCPTDPGYYTKVGTHDEGVDDVVYTFVNYCLGDEVDSVTLNGVADVKNVGEPSDSGPIPQYVELSTGTDGLQATEKSAEGSFTHIAKLDDFVYTYGNGDDGATADQPSSMTANLLSVTDGRSGEVFSVSNVGISTYYGDSSDTPDVVIDIDSVTYTDPDTGTVTVSTGTPIVVNDAGVMESGTIEVTGSNDAVLVMEPSSTIENSFDVVFDGESLGVMDCSNLTTDVVLE